MIPRRFLQEISFVLVFIRLLTVLTIASIDSAGTIGWALIFAGLGGSLLAVIFSNRLCAVPLGRTLMLLRKGNHDGIITLHLFAFLCVTRHHINSAASIFRQLLKDFTTIDQTKFPPSTLLETETWLY